MRILTLKLGEQGVNIFSALSPVCLEPSPIHSHPYPEIHVFLTGGGRYTVEGRDIPLAAGDAIVIPAGHLHATAPNEGSRVYVLQADIKVAEVAVLSLPAPILAALDGPTDAAAPSLCYLLATLAPSHLYTTRQNDDYAYLIHEYIEQNYHRPLRLADLAATLHLSERQTQRIVRRLFGVSFSSLLASHRASVAERLAAADMSWAEIAEYVGYETYSGFRRAFLRHSGDK